jgi:hypothetical protein
MLAIQVAPDENSQVAEWRARGKYSFPVLLLPAAESAEQEEQEYAGRHYGVWLAPTNLLLDAARRIAFRHLGGTGQALEVEIRELLGLPPFEGLEQAGSPDRQ